MMQCGAYYPDFWQHQATHAQCTLCAQQQLTQHRLLGTAFSADLSGFAVQIAFLQESNTCGSSSGSSGC